MRISATESDARAPAATLREAMRRLSHQASNVVNAASVNVEVLRSRLSRGGAPTESLTAFAERAAMATEQVSASVSGIRALLNVLAEVAGGSGSVRPVPGDPEAVEVVGTAVNLDRAAIRLAEAAGVALSTSPQGIILRVLRRGAVDNDAANETSQDPGRG